MPGCGDIKTGTWYYHWRRTDKNGYRFYQEMVSLEVSEDYGLVEIRLPAFSREMQQKAPVVSQAQALEIAQRAYALSGGNRAKVGIMNDEMHLNDCETKPEVVGKRLMWIFAVAGPGYMEMFIFVDAHTGEYMLGPPLG
jgi:hypothetical protein